MIVDSNYRGFRIITGAFRSSGAWDADVAIMTALSNERVCFGRVPCRKSTATMAEEYSAAYARRWVDENGEWFGYNYETLMARNCES